MKKLIAILTALFALTACTSDLVLSPTQTETPMDNNFSFIFQYISCGEVPVDILDTKSPTLIHTPLGETKSITISFQLTQAELLSVYQKVIAIDFFGYPADFTIPSGYVAVTEAPASSYQISVINGDKANNVTWIGGSSQTDYSKAIQLMELFNLVEDIIRSHPEYQQLPPHSVACL